MKIAVVATDEKLSRFLSQEIEANGCEPCLSETISEALRAAPALIFAEWPLGERLAPFLEGLRTAAGIAPPVPVIVLAPAGSVTILQRARLAGATDVLFAPPDPEEVRAEILEALQRPDARDIIDRGKFEELRETTLIGESPNFKRCVEELRKAARCDANVLLLGETGTGKEMFATAIHALSSRRSEPYLGINCASLAGNLLESELFGHVRGAFTGAERARQGRFAAVRAGTLLLDEIGDIGPPLQMKLLRVIERREFEPVGSDTAAPFLGRLIAATSIDLEGAIEKGFFRRDLLGRINQLRITLPPLRERRTDIDALARYFVRRHSRGRLVEVSASAMDVLARFDFPMNVRQMENAIVGALALSEPGRMILPRHLPPEMINPQSAARPAECMTLNLPKSLTYNEAREFALRTVDEIYLTDLLRRNGGNQSAAAEAAGIDRKTFAARRGNYRAG